MRETTFTELRRNAKTFFDAVESGETVRVYRKGKPIADIMPLPNTVPSWKKSPPPRLTIKGVSLTEEILADRESANS
jgi:antitoxin (DNA-binding transcriptional repressor) of toxin-antitoxin stability system